MVTLSFLMEMWVTMEELFKKRVCQTGINHGSIDINLHGERPLYLTYSGQNYIDLITLSFK